MGSMVSALDIFFSGIAAVLTFLGFIFPFKNYLTKKYRPSLYLAITWLGFMSEAIFKTIMDLFPAGSDAWGFLLKMQNLSLIPAFFCFFIFIESISRDSLEPIWFTILVFLLGGDAALALTQSYNTFVNPPYMIVVSIGVFASLAGLYFYIRIYRLVPVDLKRPAMLIVIGQLLVSLIFVVLDIYDQLTNNSIASIERVIEGTGALIAASVFARHEQLFYVLPFKVQRLLVFGTENGLTLFSHDWPSQSTDKLIDEDLFSGMFHGMSVFINESIKKGNVREIRLDQGVLLLSYDEVHRIAFVLIASKYSQVLREGLGGFARKFIEKHESCLDQLVDTEAFEDATELVQLCFPFIP